MKLLTVNRPVVFKSDERRFIEAAQSLQGTDELDEFKYRRLTDAKRDLSPMTFKRMQELAFYQWQRNPFAGRILEIMTDFCTGDDLTVAVRIMRRVKDRPDEDTKRPEAQKVWDDFYFDPANRLAETGFDPLILDLFLNGELVIPTAVNTGNGAVRIGYIDPANVDKVIFLENFGQQPDKLIVIKKDTVKEITKNIVRTDIDPKSKTFGKMVGDCFFFRVNYVLGQSRGHSELMRILDWTDATDQFVYDAILGFVNRNYYYVDVLMKGKTQAELDKMKFTPPRVGQAHIHNEGVELKLNAPDLKAGDAMTAVKLMQDFLLGVKGYPNTWFGSAETTTYASAQAMTVPTMRMLKAKQNDVRQTIKFMAQYVIDQKLIHNPEALKLSSNEYIDVSVSAYDFDRKDSAVVAAAFVQTLTAISLAMDKGLVTGDEGRDAVVNFLKGLGIEPQTDKTVEQIRAEKAQRDETDILAEIPDINEYLKQ